MVITIMVLSWYIYIYIHYDIRIHNAINHPCAKLEFVMEKKTVSGWWYTYPSEKYELVSWGYYSQLESHSKIHGFSHHQPGYYRTYIPYIPSINHPLTNQILPSHLPRNCLGFPTPQPSALHLKSTAEPPGPGTAGGPWDPGRVA